MKIVIFKLMDYNAAELNFRGRGPARPYFAQLVYAGLFVAGEDLRL